MSEQRDWPDAAVKEWTEMQHYEAITENRAKITATFVEIAPDKAHDDYIERLKQRNREEVQDDPRSAAIEDAVKAWRME